MLLTLDAATVSDALDACGLPPGQGGLRPMWGRPRVAGFAVTVELEPLSGQPDAQPLAERGGAHILTEAIAGAGPEDVIVVANGGRTDVSSWGGDRQRRRRAALGPRRDHRRCLPGRRTGP